MGVNGKVLQLHVVYKNYVILQVTRESVSGTTSLGYFQHRVYILLVLCNTIFYIP